MINFSFPKDLTPGQRARLKLYSHIAIIALFNGIMAALAALSDGHTISWSFVLDSFLAQCVLAGLDALKKYYSASGQVPLSMMLDFARQEVAQRVQPAQSPPDLQALANTITNNLLSAQMQIGPPSATNVTKIVPLTGMPERPIETINTIPNIAAIKPNS